MKVVFLFFFFLAFTRLGLADEVDVYSGAAEHVDFDCGPLSVLSVSLLALNTGSGGTVYGFVPSGYFVQFSFYDRVGLILSNRIDFLFTASDNVRVLVCAGEKRLVFGELLTNPPGSSIPSSVVFWFYRLDHFSFPILLLLLGLAGIVCASFLVYVFLKGVR